MKFSSVDEVKNYLLEFRKSGLGQKKPGFTFERVKYLAERVGNPQNQIKVVHTAGTSGKGSTCTIMSHLLENHDFKVGLSISPHLYDIRERMQINNKLISEKAFCAYFSEIYPEIEHMKDSKYGIATYYEIMIVLPYYIFWKENVDYAVMETGAGGRLDATNVANRKDKLAIITKIGLDHIDILGSTLKEIAGEKAAVIHKENTAITIKQRPSAQKVIQKHAKEAGAFLNIIEPEVHFKNVKPFPSQLRFDFTYKEANLQNVYLSLQGIYQVENASLALAALYELSQRDGFQMDEKAVRDTCMNMKTPGRFEELIIEDKRIIIDGAHNPQKMSAFIRSLKTRHKGDTFDFLLSFKHGKDYKSMLKYIVPIAKKIYLTQFILDNQSYEVKSEPIDNTEKVLKEMYSFANVEKIPNAEEALHKARQANDTILVVTGSLYLLGELYKKMHDMIDKDSLEE